MPKLSIPNELPDKALGFIRRFPGCTVERVATFLGYGVRRRGKNRLAVPFEVEQTIAVLLERKAIRQEVHPFASPGDLPQFYVADYQAPKLFTHSALPVVKVSTDPGAIAPRKPQRRAIDDIPTHSTRSPIAPGWQSAIG